MRIQAASTRGNRFNTAVLLGVSVTFFMQAGKVRVQRSTAIHVRRGQATERVGSGGGGGGQ